MSSKPGQVDPYISDRTVDIAEARELIMNTKSAVISTELHMYTFSRSLPNHSDSEYCSWVSDVYVPGSVFTVGMQFRKGDLIRDIYRFK